MNSLIIYLFKSSGILLIFYLVYRLFLRRETFFTSNRIYLIGMVLLSLLLPFIPVNLFSVGQSPTLMVLLEPVVVTSGKINSIITGHFGWIEIAGAVYVSGLVLLTLRLFFRLFQLLFITRRYGVTRRHNLKLVCIDHGLAPFSFFNLVYINEKAFSEEALEAILAHEKVHVNQAHTCDILMVELLCILQWFNPFAWLTLREIKSLHEFLADEAVLKSGIDRIVYQKIILNETVGIQVNYLTNNFNVSLLKKRISMMTKVEPSFWTMSKYLFVLPAFMAVAFFLSASTAFSNMPQSQDKPVKKQNTEKKQKKAEAPGDEVFTVVEQMPTYPRGNDAMSKLIADNIKYPEAAKKNNIQGTVYVSFVIAKDGSVTKVKVVKGIGSGCDEEAIRVVKLMLKWKPGKQAGQVVNVQFTLPIKFALN